MLLQLCFAGYCVQNVHMLIANLRLDRSILLLTHAVVSAPCSGRGVSSSW
jgi:hypothetical protein